MRTVRNLAILLTLTASVIVFAPSGAAQADSPCPSPPPLERSFASMLDANLYFRLPTGGFEDGTDGWDLGRGARIVGGANEPYLPEAPTDSHVLNLPSGSSVEAPLQCVDGTATFMRFFARSKGLAGIAVVVVQATNDAGYSQTLLSTALPLTSAWSSPLLLFRLPLLGDGFTSMTISIHSIGLGGIDVDDVFIDPLKQR